MNRSKLLLVPALLMASCSPKDDADRARTDSGTVAPAASDAAPTTSGGDRDLRDVTSYRLTMDKIDRYYVAQRNLMLKMKDMSQAERDAVDLGFGSGDETLEQMAAKLERNPAVRSAIRDAGMSTREFATLTMAMVQAGMAAAVLQMRPNDNQDSLVREMEASMENIRFMRQNEAELQRKQKAFEAEMRRLGVPVTDRDTT